MILCIFMFISSLVGFVAGFVELAGTKNMNQVEQAREQHKQNYKIAFIASGITLVIAIGIFVYMKMKSGKVVKQQTK